jgi:uncharacterized protein with FMN-binding domain
VLSPSKKHQSLAGKLLLSTALVAVSLAYGWWQRHTAADQNMAAPVPVSPAVNKPVTVRSRSAVTAPAGAPATRATGDIGAAAPTAPSQENVRLPALSPATPVSALAELEMYQPPPVQPPLALVTGTPALGASPPIPAGTRLADGDYLSDTEQFEWGDVTVRISVQGGLIRGVQIVNYPDHRAESLQISQMASPLLDSEVIQTQQSKVDIVSSATDTSYVFRDAIANAIKKATRP